MNDNDSNANDYLPPRHLNTLFLAPDTYSCSDAASVTHAHPHRSPSSVGGAGGDHSPTAPTPTPTPTPIPATQMLFPYSCPQPLASTNAVPTTTTTSTNSSSSTKNIAITTLGNGKGYKCTPVPDQEATMSPYIKRPMNSFLVWSRTERPKLAKQHRDLQNAEISRMLGERWKEMTPEQKQPYVDHAKSLQQRHKAAFPSYR